MVNLDEFRGLLEEELNSNTENRAELEEYFKCIRDGEEISEQLLKHPEFLSHLLVLTDASRKFVKVLYPLIFSLIKENSDQSVKLALQFIPSVIWLYLSSLRSSEPSESAAILSHLATNLSEMSGVNFRMPSIHVTSIYHHPAKMHFSGGLTEATLARGFNMEPLYNESPSREVFTEITASNRLAILTLLCERYVHFIGDATPASMERFLRLSVWLSVSGMGSLAPPVGSRCEWEPSTDRFTLNRPLMTALVSGVHHCLYNGFAAAGKVSLECLTRRAEYEIYPEVMMLCASLRDSMEVPSRRPFGIALPDLSGTLEDQRPQRRSIIRQEDINVLLRKRISSNEIREESDTEGVSPASVMLDVSDSDGSEIHTAGFRGGRWQNV